MAKITVDDLMELNIEERLVFLEDAWDRIAAEPDSVPLTQAQREELDRRLEAHRRNPSRGSSWKEVRSRLQP